MRILFLSPRQSFPARSGARLRESHFLRALGARAEVTFLYFADPGATPLTVNELPFCREVIAVPKPPAYGLSKTARGIFGRLPLPILNYASADMDAAVAGVMQGRKFDIIHLDSIHMMQYAAAAAQRQPSLRAIYNWHNIESEAMRRYASTTTSHARGCYARLTASRLKHAESEILRTAFGHVVCSARECLQLGPIAPRARIEVIENGVDTGYFAACGQGPAGGRKIVFVGALDYPANKESAIFFANRIWPHVRNRLNGAEFVIVGSNPSPPVLALGKLPGVTVAGMVPDVRPFYRDALAAVVPLLTGGGTRLKILEAMAAGVPVVSTPLGAEGLEVVDGENALVVGAEDAEGWASRFVDLAENPALRARLIAAGLRLVQSGYDWDIIGAKLCAVYEGWLRGDSSASAR
ncbi:MAG TPA: glycosyltransferase [Bryobacteraceae bacterium]|nr:glycosyltransferase [Bryobacteraceae bacterium]